jgi:hypothetical protein
MAERYFHVTSSLNRESIARYGLDSRRMSAAPGIAGSTAPEQGGCFLCLSEFEKDWFVGMNNTGGTVDIWAVDGVDGTELVVSPENYHFVPRVIPPECLSIVECDVLRPWPTPESNDAATYQMKVRLRPRRRRHSTD